MTQVGGKISILSLPLQRQGKSVARSVGGLWGKISILRSSIAGQGKVPSSSIFAGAWLSDWLRRTCGGGGWLEGEASGAFCG